ncbi:MAG: gamma-glutamyltransferase family protein [Lachnospiraceae bacterium]|nr:gamma-glutamyltransferase family protein [Lachnospiraceae bacterium]
MSYGFDPLYCPYPSTRYPVYARGGMVNSSTPQAASAGLEILRRGGNAMDAAVAAAAALTVTEPTSNGLGSDAFALIWSEKDQKLYGLNSSGPAPMLLSPENLEKDGRIQNGRIEERGWAPVTVPGAVKAWSEVSSRFGRLPFADLLAPAIDYAENGYPAGANLAYDWAGLMKHYKANMTGEEFNALYSTFTTGGATPAAGDLVRLPDLARTLKTIAESHTEDFYHGELARRIDAESRKYGGYLRFEDLDRYKPVWVEPATVDYRGYTVCEIPPNGQGIVALMALNILQNLDVSDREDPMTYHRRMEAMKIAFADGLHAITDPREYYLDSAASAGAAGAEDSLFADPAAAAKLPLPEIYRWFMSPEYGKRRAAEITDTAGLYTYLTPPASGTVYFCTADGEGNMVSFIQSNYEGFGSGIVVEGTGIALQNRGFDFSLDPSAANFLRPGKRTYHTIIPGFLMKDGLPVGPFGVMGGYMQPQGHLQVVSNFVDFHLNPQQCIDAPRFQWMKEKEFLVESSFDTELARSLSRMGHKISVELMSGIFGRGQMIVRTGDGVLCGGTEMRCSGSIAMY